MGTESEIKTLTALAAKEIAHIKTIPPPVVRVSGPLTSDGPARYQYHAGRLLAAEQILRSRGISVWSFCDVEKEIYEQGYAYDNIMRYFHKPILASGLIKEVYFLPQWERSRGATKEREIAIANGIPVTAFLEEWFLDEAQAQGGI